MIEYAVYVMQIKATNQCKRSKPFEYYVGSTYVDNRHGVKDRIQNHRDGWKSNVVKRGYIVISGSQSGRLYSTRNDAEKAEKKLAEEMRKEGKLVWQG